MLTMTRRLGFSAAKADWLDHLTSEQNHTLFGETASPEPYGHNYTLDVGVKGEIDPRTGMVINIKILDNLVKERVISVLDRKFLNRAAPEFRETPPTVEALTRFIVQKLRDDLPSEITLASIRLEETPLLFSEWQLPEESEGLEQNKFEKEEEIIVQITHVYEFSAAHRLDSPHLTESENKDVFGKCNNPAGHGHNYVLEVTIAGQIGANGRVIDPVDLDCLVKKEVVDRYDHKHLNEDLEDFSAEIPSAEVITKTIWTRLVNQVPAPARLSRIVLRETARNIFEYRGEEN